MHNIRKKNHNARISLSEEKSKTWFHTIFAVIHVDNHIFSDSWSYIHLSQPWSDQNWFNLELRISINGNKLVKIILWKRPTGWVIYLCFRLQMHRNQTRCKCGAQNIWDGTIPRALLLGKPFQPSIRSRNVTTYTSILQCFTRNVKHMRLRSHGLADQFRF